MITRIGILGIGGVGGFIGGRLAAAYANSDDIEIVFIPRPRKVELLRSRGLKIIVDTDETVVHPHLVSADPEEIGVLDVLICSTKSYDIVSALQPLAPCIQAKTLILPLLNGVDSVEHIREMFPRAQVADGCIYIVARILEPGVIKVGGYSHALHFGGKGISSERLEKLQRILSSAGINAAVHDHIKEVVWEKFFFISALASLTSYLDLPVGKIMENEEYKDMLKGLLSEFLTVAKASGINLGEGIFEKVWDKMQHLPYETTSSMHGDFKKGGQTEYRSLTKYICDLGDSLNIETPVYDRILKAFTASQN